MRTGTAVGCLFLALATVWATSSAGAARPNFDINAKSRPGVQTVALQQLADDPGLRQLGRVAHVEERFGVPTFFWANRVRPAAPPAFATSAQRSPEHVARDFIARLAPVYRLDLNDVSGAKLHRIHDTGRGGIIVSFKQEIDGIEVFRDEVRVMMNRSLELISISGYIPSKAASKSADRAFDIEILRAAELASEDFAEVASVRGGLRAAGDAPGGYHLFELTSAAPGQLSALDVGGPLRAKPVFFNRPTGLEPAYYVEVMGAEEAYAYVISAKDGTLLFRKSLMNDIAFTYRVWADPTGDNVPTDGPQGNSPSPHPTGIPDGFDPPFTAPILVTLESGPISTGDKWLHDLATSTVGNNVDAYADLSAPDGFSGGDLRASTTAANEFDRTYDTLLNPNASTDQRMASVTQLFYVNNFLHDWFYDSGFDEASGNAQGSNFGRGGIGGDRIRAEAQDYSGTNNANMSTPADGSSPRMQMYVFTGSGPVKVTANAPGGVAGDYVAGSAVFGPQVFNVTADVVEVIDGAAPVTDACSAILNNVSGKIALIDRGSCTFVSKCIAAQNAGAVGVILVDNQIAATPPGMGGEGSVTIPILSVTNADGATLRAELGNGLNVTLDRGPSLDPDGTLDNAIVAHEWGHYISNRLIGNASGLNNQQGSGMGEGWGDFHSLLMMVREGDDLVPSNTDFGGVYPSGGYAVHSPGSGDEAYYFGIRRVPYSTDFTKNALTFKHISNGIALPVGPPTAFGSAGTNNAEVHNTGEVWCTMLWECYAALLSSGRMTFDEARDRMRDYLVGGYKMTPNSPTLVEARDGILAAVGANDVDDYIDFWLAFARRGIGMGAIAPDRNSTTNTGVVESFVVGGDLAFISAEVDDSVQSCDSDGVLDDGEVGELTVTLVNTGATLLSSTTATVTTTNPAISFPGGNLLNFPASLPFATPQATLQVVLFGAGGIEDLDFHLEYDDPGLLVSGPYAADFSVSGHADLTASTLETVEAPNLPWDIDGDVGTEPWRVITASPGDHHFFVPNDAALSDQFLETPPLDLAPGLPFIIDFEHAHSFESDISNDYDGGVVEISNDGGNNWLDVSSYGSPGYGGTIFAGASNPLAGRSAYVDQNPSYPSLDPVSIDLGMAFAGQTVRIRFRIGCDVSAGDYGWEIDDISFANITNQPFTEIAVEPDACTGVAVNSDVPREVSFAIAGANPVVGPAQFRFALPKKTQVELSIFDVSGRRIATLADGEYSPGHHGASWGAVDVAAGVYFARMRADGRVFKQRVLLLR